MRYYLIQDLTKQHCYLVTYFAWCVSLVVLYFCLNKATLSQTRQLDKTELTYYLTLATLSHSILFFCKVWGMQFPRDTYRTTEVNKRKSFPQEELLRFINPKRKRQVRNEKQNMRCEKQVVIIKGI